MTPRPETPVSADVLVVGAGFAGITAARELARLGLSSIVVEARDRVGGRTYRSALDGHPVELGGAGYIHWSQPFVWSEVMRGDLRTYAPDPIDKAYLLRSNGVHDVDPADLDRRLSESYTEFFAGLADVMPEPFDPSRSDAVLALDEWTVADRLASLGLDADSNAVFGSLLEASCHGPMDRVGLLAVLRWRVLCGARYEDWDAATSRYRVVGGTAALLDAIASEQSLDIRLSQPVAEINNWSRGVEVIGRDGARLTASAVIVTVPGSTMSSIRFGDGLSETRQRHIDHPPSAQGSKIVLRVRGDHRSLGMVEPGSHRLTTIGPVGTADGDTLMAAFGPNTSLLDSDAPEVRTAVNAVLPDAEVLSFIGHNWAADEFSRGTWPMAAPHCLASLPELQRPEGRLVFAGTELASGWNGFLDGAIESGVRAAHQAKSIVS
jgi:monoamine oxidase